jgi:hypothetical protein
MVRVLAYADERGRDAFTFEPITSHYIKVADNLVVTTTYFPAVIAELRMVRWDSESKPWHVPFRSFDVLHRRQLAISAAARLKKRSHRTAEGRLIRAAKHLALADEWGRNRGGGPSWEQQRGARQLPRQMAG